MIEISSFLQGAVKIRCLNGRLGDTIEEYRNQKQESFYMKSVKGYERKSLRQEWICLKYLEDKKVNVPIPISFDERDDSTRILISSIDGKGAHEYSEVYEVLEIAAKALIQIHKININDGIELDHMIQKSLDELTYFMEEDLIDHEEFYRVNKRYPQDIYNYLVKKMGMFREDVYTHGDFCLPNIIIDKNKDYGIIDWGQGGISDRYRDFAAMEKSIHRNFGEEYIPLFYKCYGLDIDEIEREKIEFFHYMDQFQYHRKELERI